MNEGKKLYAYWPLFRWSIWTFSIFFVLLSTWRLFVRGSSLVPYSINFNENKWPVIWITSNQLFYSKLLPIQSNFKYSGLYVDTFACESYCKLLQFYFLRAHSELNIYKQTCLGYESHWTWWNRNTVTETYKWDTNTKRLIQTLTAKKMCNSKPIRP